MDRRLTAFLLTVLIGAAFSGCGSKDQAPTASISGPALGDPQGGTSATPAATVSHTRARKSSTNPLYPKVLIETTLGNITVKLDGAKAPLTVDNFLTYADQKHYDQTLLHQVVKNYVIVGGSFTPEGKEKKTRTPIRNEAHNGVRNRRGTLAMARLPDAVDSATAQFFVNLRDNEQLDHKDRTLQGYGYCVFGEVVAGQEVLDQIGNVEVRNTQQFEHTPVTPVVIKAIRRLPD